MILFVAFVVDCSSSSPGSKRAALCSSLAEQMVRVVVPPRNPRKNGDPRKDGDLEKSIELTELEPSAPTEAEIFTSSRDVVVSVDSSVVATVVPRKSCRWCELCRRLFEPWHNLSELYHENAFPAIVRWIAAPPGCAFLTRIRWSSFLSVHRGKRKILMAFFRRVSGVTHLKILKLMVFRDVRRKQWACVFMWWLCCFLGPLCPRWNFQMMGHSKYSSLVRRQGN